MDLVSHHYVSTACHHGIHVRCRETCKFCDMPCACHCHHEKENNVQPA